MKKCIAYVIPILLVIVIVVSGTFVIKDMTAYKQAEEEYETLHQYMKEETPEQSNEKVEKEESEEPVEEYPAMAVDFAALKEMNSDFVGVLYVPALEIKYPVAASKDNMDYLNRTFEGQVNASGCIFLDQYADRSLQDANTIIYGHNMKDGSMFGSLKRFYEEEDLVKNDPYIYVYTEDAVYKYEIYSYYLTDITSFAYNGFQGESGYDAYVEKSRNQSMYETEDINWKERPNILTLSTCSGTDHISRFIVHSALIQAFSEAPKKS